MKTDPNILQAAATFNSHHDYDIEAILAFVSVALRHAHSVQLARVKEQNPQLELPIE